MEKIIARHTDDEFYLSVNSCRQSFVDATHGSLGANKDTWYADARERYDAIKNNPK